MTEHVDFELQETLHRRRAAAARRLFLLPGAAASSPTPRCRSTPTSMSRRRRSNRAQGRAERHARQVREHIRALSSKGYQGQFKAGEMPDLVICFIPSEPALHAAFEAEPSLYDYALEQKVLIVRPTTLIGLLRTVELGWRQERSRRGGRDRRRRRKLHSRSGSSSTTSPRPAVSSSSATKSYNCAVGSLESRIMPQLRRIEEMGVASGKAIEPPKGRLRSPSADHRAGAPDTSPDEA